MKIKTAKLEGVALDWAVAQCENRKHKYWMNDGIYGRYSPPTYWGLGGPIIEREKIRLVFRDLGVESYWCAQAHEAYRGNRYVDGKGPTPLIAAMRCYVASKLGEEVDVPEEVAR